MISSFTLISLIGVMLGVLVLVVVMAVYSGLERDVKKRLLGFTPHILINQVNTGPMREWDGPAQQAKKLPHVQEATAYVSDNVIVDVQGSQRPALFRGIDTRDTAGIAQMLDPDYPGSSADMGIDDRVVISSTLARQFGLGLGDEIRLYSARNSEEVLKVFQATENPPVREFFAPKWKLGSETLTNGWQDKGGAPALSTEAFETAYQALYDIYGSVIREAERESLEQILVVLDSGEADLSGKFKTFTKDSKDTIAKAIATLNSSDAEKMDVEILKSLKKLVLAKKAVVIGVYKASQMAATPDVFMPLPLAQDLAGLDDAVQGIALRLDNADNAESAAIEIRRILGPDWSAVTWGQEWQTFFNLINQQRAMMYFALSFIVLVSAFSMMAVMFTVTIQKRREIGVMKALGAAPGQIVRVFLYQGMILGVAGAILGVGLGRLVIRFRGEIQAVFRQLGFDPFSSQFTGFGTLPAHNDPAEQAMFALMAFILCSFAALVPAFFAARSDAAKSLRNL